MSTTRSPLEPSCACFRNNRAEMEMRITYLAAIMQQGFVDGCSAAGMCREASILLMHEMVISVATHIALIEAPAIEHASAEAEHETLEVLRGIEGRLVSQVKYHYEQARKYTPEQIREMFEQKRRYMTGGS